VRKALLVTAIVLALLAVAGWLGDNALRTSAEDRAATAIQSTLALTQKPDITIEGFPFSLSLLTRSVPGARASAASVPLELSGHTVHVTGVRAQTGELSLSGNRAHVASGTVTGVLGYGDLAEIAGLPVSYAGGGRVRLTYTTVFAGQQLSIGVTALPVLDTNARKIRLTKPKLDSESSLPVSLTAAQVARLARPIAVELPKGARVTALTPSEGGVAVAATLTDLTFAVG
jgi:hypothetical protein